MNYYNVQVEIFQKQLHILLNVHYPLLAFARVAKYDNIDFIDEPILVQEFSPFYQVLQTTELNKPLNLSLDAEKWMLQNDYQFNEAELEEIVFWNPETIGEIIFNHWD
ncbi:hypothetical protein [Bacillus massiliigorillae]|uniref:hypothetical protein n=1 Tax=Bacillus massiliigorillae TaxID=1243664 RepID=UPI00039F5AE8|nr:hypothetical protein [Bacillus massiliigorillae]